jgi:sulfate adenylyltransferase large subunit
MSAADTPEVLSELEDFLEANLGKELLRFTTAGSVDDGKSTLIGRLLHDSKAVYEDQLASIRKSRINRAAGPIDFSLLTDGLRAEREQGITIDVAYRYFSTSRRKFIIADTPGHEQYTRNMATGASTADLAIILIDATKGLLPQTRRHTYIAALLGIPNVVGAINKMDLVDYDERVFAEMEHQFAKLAEHLRVPFVQCIPISALEGDNIVLSSSKTDWYSGPTLLKHLETVPLQRNQGSQALRFPVQAVIRPDQKFRGFAGQLASGRIAPGDAIVALPSRQQAKVQAIVSYDGDLDEAITGQSVMLKLDKEIDLSRGDMIVSASALPHISNRFGAMVVWLHEKPLRPGQVYLLKHAGKVVKAKAAGILYGIDVNALGEITADHLAMNEIGYVEFESSAALYFDAYVANRTTGSFILIDPLSNATLGAAMIREDLSRSRVGGDDVAGFAGGRPRVSIEERYERHGHRPAVFVVEANLALGERLERALFEHGFQTALIRNDEVPSSAVPVLIRSLWDAGLLVIYFTEQLSVTGKAILKEIGGDFVFKIEAAAANKSVDDILRDAVNDAEILRFPRRAGRTRGYEESH